MINANARISNGYRHYTVTIGSLSPFNFIFKIKSLIFWPHWVFCYVHTKWLSLVAASGGYLLVALWGLLIVVASDVTGCSSRFAGFICCCTQTSFSSWGSPWLKCLPCVDLSSWPVMSTALRILILGLCEVSLSSFFNGSLLTVLLNNPSDYSVLGCFP